MRQLSLAIVLVISACGPAVNDGSGGDDDDGAGDDGGPGDDDPDATPGDPAENAAVYAHSADALYRVDPESFEVTKVGDFQWPGGGDDMTDLAIDKDGRMIGISYTRVYEVDPDTAGCTLLSDALGGSFNGLSFVPATQAGRPADGPDVLVASRNSDGTIMEIDPNTGGVTPIGAMGGNWVSSGDIVSVAGFGTVLTATTVGSLGADVLVRLAPGSFEAQVIGTTGYNDLWGIGFWKGEVFGFAENGQFVLVDTTTGVGAPVETSEPRWWGAAVTTAAPIVD